LFITALDARRRWYRYHHLFAESLRTRLDAIDRDRPPVLHGRASLWFERAGLVHDAIQHALAAGDFERAADLVAGAANRLWMRSEVTTLQAWLDQFPPDFLATRPALGIYRAWSLFFTNRIEAVEAELATIESRLSTSALPSASRIATLVLAIRACVASVTGQYSTAIEYSRRALLDLGGEPVWRTVVLQSLGTGLRAAGDVDSAV
jgi:LuxR family maltose regulon positive regulatory protein